MIFLLLLLTLGSGLTDVCFLRLRQRQRHGAALVLKGLAALQFCLIGLLLHDRAQAGWAVAAGLFCGLTGDILLGLRKLMPHRHDLTFVAGALVFCLGHGFYIYYLTRIPGLWLPALPIFLVLLILSEAFARYGGFHRGKMHLPGMFYIAAEALMAALSLVLVMKAFSAGSLLFALGGVSFLVSDNLLCAYSFGRLKSPSIDWALHGTYLAAQLLIGWSLYF